MCVSMGWAKSYCVSRGWVWSSTGNKLSSV